MKMNVKMTKDKAIKLLQDSIENLEKEILENEIDIEEINKKFYITLSDNEMSDFMLNYLCKRMTHDYKKIAEKKALLYQFEKELREVVNSIDA